ncbi:glycosyltransferase family 2 protein [Oscillospiraceae bacterium NTUH-002-81]|nr:glycosyltransferase family 2 protein [Oscillospiraceae bacterium NTUH-002-81]
MNDNWKVSIITTTFNDAAHLRQIMEQVLRQTYENIEYIVVDGASKDGTIDLLKEMEPAFGGRLRWISEPDAGIYDAINKGVRLATGDLIGCCFDHFTGDDVIARMVDVIRREGTDGVHADLVYKDGDKVIRTWRQGQGNIRFGWMPGHPTLYLKREVYEKFGLYKTDYVCSADYEYMVRILKDGEVRLSYIPETLIEMDYGGTSTSSLKAYWVSLVEGHRGLKENQVRFAWFTDACRILRLFTQFIRR